MLCSLKDVTAQCFITPGLTDALTSSSSSSSSTTTTATTTTTTTSSNAAVHVPFQASPIFSTIALHLFRSRPAFLLPVGVALVQWPGKECIVYPYKRWAWIWEYNPLKIVFKLHILSSCTSILVRSYNGNPVIDPMTFISTLLLLILCCFVKVQFSHRCRNFGTVIILCNRHISSLFILTVALRIS